MEPIPHLVIQFAGSTQFSASRITLFSHGILVRVFPYSLSVHLSDDPTPVSRRHPLQSVYPTVVPLHNPPSTSPFPPDFPEDSNNPQNPLHLHSLSDQCESIMHVRPHL